MAASSFPMPSFDFSDASVIEPLIAARISIEERPLKRLFKRFQSLVHFPPPLTLDENSEDYKNWREELLICQSNFLVELKSFRFTLEEKLKGGERVMSVEMEKMGSAKDGQTHTGLAGEYERRISQVLSQISTRYVDLAAAQQLRAQKHTRNSVARQIAAYSPRASSEQTISKLKADIANLESELSGYGEKWRKRKETFDEAVGVLESLEDEIREEKEIKARRLVGVEEDEHEHEHENENEHDGEEGHHEGEAEGEGEGEGEMQVDGEEGERKSNQHNHQHHLDPKAPEFVPSHISSSSRPSSHPPTPNPNVHSRQLSQSNNQGNSMDVDEPEGEGEEANEEINLISDGEDKGEQIILLSDGEEEEDPRRGERNGGIEEGEEPEEGEMS